MAGAIRITTFCRLIQTKLLETSFNQEALQPSFCGENTYDRWVSMHFVLPQFYLAFQCIVHFSKWLLLLLSVQVIRNRHSVGRLRDTTSSSHTSVITCNFKRILGFTTNCKSYYVLKSCQQARYNSGPTKNSIRVIGKHLSNNFIHMPIG